MLSTSLILSWLALYKDLNKKTLKSLFKSILIILTPVMIGGEMTNIIIRLIYTVLFFSNKSRKNIINIFSNGFLFMICLMFILPLFVSVFENIFDANSFWRLRYWNDQLKQVLYTKFIGVGYGTTYATENFTGQIKNIIGGPFGATIYNSTLEKLFIVSSHNSYISVFFRLGLIGIGLFLYMLFKISSYIKKNYKTITLTSIFLFYSSVVLIGVNVGLESPYYLLMFIFSIGNVLFDINYPFRKSKKFLVNNITKN